jgi:glutamine amidotransferase
MGWNTLRMNDNDMHPVLRGITKKPDGTYPDFYFVHSFVFDCKDTAHVAAWCEYGEKFAAIVAKDNMIGCQFHPEKSQRAGLDLIRGFLHWKP